jgi:hypothetical protein
MSAIITDTFRRSNTQAFVNDVTSGTTNKYYVGIGRSDRWDANEDTSYPIPNSTGGYSDSLEVLNNIEALQQLTGTGADNTAKIAIPNVALIAGQKYKTYNSHDSSCFLPDVANGLLPCYGLRSGIDSLSYLYMCVSKFSDATTLAAIPNDTSVYDIQLMGTAGNSTASYWVLVQVITSPPTDQFLIVRTTALTSSTTPTLATVKSGAGGAVTGLHVVNGGRYATDAVLTGYLYYSDDTTGSVTPSTVVPITTANITTTTQSGYKTITAVTLPNIGTWQKGVTEGSVRIISTTSTTILASDYPAIIAPIVAPINGYGYNPFTVMPSWYASLEATLTGNISGDSLFNSYRQISVIKNPTVNGSPSGGTSTLNGLKYLTITSTTGTPAQDLIEGALLCQTTAGSGGTAANNLNGRLKVVGIVDTWDSTNSKLYYHQNYWTGFGELDITTTLVVSVGSMDSKGVITLSAGNTTATYSNNTAEKLDNAEIKDDSVTYSRGEVLFVENRKKITRSSTQTEKIKIIIQF